MATRRTTTSKPKTTTTSRSSTTRTRASTAKTRASTAKPTPTPTVVTDATPDVTGPELKKKELIDQVVEKSGVKKKFAKPAVEALLAVMGEALGEGREINAQPLGKVKINRAKDLSNGRVIIAKIRQSTQAIKAAEEKEETVSDTVADAAE